MDTKVIVILIVVFVMVAAAAFLFTQAELSYTPSSQGTLVYALTDAATDMNSISSIKMTISSVQAHSAAQGWITLSSMTQTFDLIELKAQGKTVLVARANVSPDNYDQVRVYIDSVIVTDVNGTTSAKVPSGEIKIVGTVKVAANTTSSAVLDFLADESLHVAGSGQYIFAPVIQFQTRNNATINIDSQNNVEISRGNIDTDAKVGMDVNGNVGAGLNIPLNSTINIDTSGNIRIGL